MQLKFIVANQVEKMPYGFQWPLNHLPSCKNNYILIYFGMPLKMDDISVIFIFIQIDINRKYKSHMQLQTTLWLLMQLQFVFTKCHEGQSYVKLQKWLIWIEVVNAWVGMEMIPRNEIN